MTPEQIDPVEESAEKMSLQQKLYLAAKEVAKAENIRLETLPSQYEKHYIKLDPSLYDRCVDGRTVLEYYENNEEKPTGFTPDTYRGPQFAGATAGLVDVIMKTTNMEESKVWESVIEAYEENGATLGMHIDDDHGHKLTEEQLSDQEGGCGDQAQKIAGNVSTTKLTEKKRKQRLNRVRKVGVVAPLTGEHDENLAAFNLIEGTTFNTPEAVEDGESIFNGDVAVAYERAGWVYDHIKDDLDMDQEEFQMEVAKEMMVNYIQTAKALTPKGETFEVMYVRASD